MRRIIAITIMFTALLCAFDFSGDTQISPNLKELIEAVPPAEDFPNASYYILTDSMIVRTLPGGGYEKEHYYLAKAYTYRGKRALANFKILYNPDFEKVELLRARTINADEVIPVDEPEVNEINPPAYSKATVYAKMTQMVASLPAFAESSIIEIHYKITAANSPVPFGGFKILVEENPARKLFFALSSSSGEKVNYLSVSDAPEPKISGQQTGWTIENYRGIQFEPDIPPVREILPTVIYTASRNWQNESESIAGMFLPHAIADDKIAAVAESLASGTIFKDNKYALESVVYYLQENIKKININPNLIGYRPNDAAKVFENGYADSRDMAVLLIAMLKVLEIDAHPILVNSHGSNIWDIPSVHQFNRVAVLVDVDGEEIFIDPMEQYASTGFIESANGERAFVIKPGRSELVEIPNIQPEKNSVVYIYDFQIKDNGAVSGSVRTDALGETAARLREDFRHAKKSKTKQRFQKAASNIADGAKIQGEKELKGIDVNSGRATASFSLTADGFLTIQDRMAILWLPKAPFDLISLPDISMDEREFPLFLEIPLRYEKRINIEFPAKYDVVYSPPETHIENEAGSIDISSRVVGTMLNVVVNLSLKKKRISTDEYEELKELIRTMTAKRFRIVLFESQI